MTLKCLLAAFIVALAPGAASAATIDFLGLGNAEIVTIAGVRPIRAWAGELEWAWKEGSGATHDPFYSYCVDLLNNAQDPQDEVTVRSTDGLATNGMTTTAYASQKAVWLFNTYAADAHDSSDTWWAAGLQLAIWEVLYDDGLSLTAGTGFYVTAASEAAKLAGQGYLNALNAPGTDYINATSALWLDVESAKGQDQITRAVPEPGTLLFLGTGLAGLAVRRRRKSQA